MLRGEIRLVDFGQGLPGEAAKRRPAVIVSNDGANSTAARLGRGALTVVPMTTNVESVYPFQVVVTARSSQLEHDSKAQAEQVRTISFERVGESLGAIPAPLMLELDEALRIHLSL